MLGTKDCILILPSGHPASSYCLRAIQHLCLRAIQHVHNAFGPSSHTAFGPSLHSYCLRAIQHAAAGVIREVAIVQAGSESALEAAVMRSQVKKVSTPSGPMFFFPEDQYWYGKNMVSRRRLRATARADSRRLSGESNRHRFVLAGS